MEKQEQLTEEKRYCKCGCGQEIIIKSHHKYRGIPNYIYGHCSKGRFVKGQISFMKGKCHKEESKLKNRLSHLGKKNTEGHNKKIGLNNARFWKGKNLPEKIKRNISNTKKEYYLTNDIWNKGKTDIYSKETLYKMSSSQKKLWQNPEYKEKMLLSFNRTPTSYEQRISDLCFKFNLPFIYTGNGNFFIKFKNPDFINEKDKIVIEVFNSYFKVKNYGSIENYKEFCKKKYEPSGWKVIFLDENDVLAENWEERCLNKINEVLMKC